MRRYAAILLLALLAPPSVDAKDAENAAFTGKHFVYRADGKRLSEVLADFAASQSLPLILDPAVEGTVNANFNVRPQEFLEAISHTYGIIWYFDGTTLYIYPSSAMQSRIFHMRGFDRRRVETAMASLGLGDARFPLRFDDANQTLLAYGPPRHIELVATVLNELQSSGVDRVGTSIRLFALRFATAGDRTFGADRVAGLASTLNGLFAGPSASSPPAATPSSDRVVGQADRVKAAQATYGAQLSGDASRKAPAPTSSAGEAPLAGDSPLAERPFFQADESTNSIIVRGLPERMNEYEALIHQLDTPQDLVQIEASIMDVSSDDFDALGIDWNYSVNGQTRFSLTPGMPGASPLDAPSSTLTGTNVTTLVTSGVRQLLANVRALQGSGKARIVARPKVLGVVNRTATMSDRSVASVRVAGNLDANLFTIETGTVLKVTPQIVSFGDHDDVRLSLMIQDGQFENTTVDSVPIIKQTEIDTEASVHEGESLLIGGISVDSDVQGYTGIPVLSRIPFIGALFRDKESTKSHSERLFLLTPRIVRVNPTAWKPSGAAGEEMLLPQSTPVPLQALPPTSAGPKRAGRQPSATRRRQQDPATSAPDASHGAGLQLDTKPMVMPPDPASALPGATS